MVQGSIGRRWIAVLAGAAVAALLGVAPARAQISGVSSSNAGSFCSQANGTTGFCGSSTSLVTSTSTQFTSRFAWNLNADSETATARDTSGGAQHNVSFTVTSPGAYRLDVTSALVGAMTRLSDAAGCRGAADISFVNGTTDATVSEGTLFSLDPGEVEDGTGDATVPFSTSTTAVIYGVSNGTPKSHVLTFTSAGSVRSNSCEASVRLGETNGTTTGCTACGYPGSPSRTQSGDGHFVTVT
jgi:hypothetical protein